MLQRKNTREIYVGNVKIGGTAPVSIQSMTKTDTRDVKATLAQIRQLSEAGCEIVRLAIPDHQAVEAFRQILKKVSLPLIADIHFDYRLALEAIEAGAHGLRINPGNIGSVNKLGKVAAAAGRAKVPVRVGVNGGSLPPALRRAHGGVTPEALCECALEYCRMLEDMGCSQLKVSLKASSVPLTVAACRLFSQKADYPLHLGITEAGSISSGMIKSAIGIGALLLDGIGDTVRVSLTGDPVVEVKTGIQILEATGLRQAQPEIISCPTCGRTEFDLCAIVDQVEKEIASLKTAGRRINLRRIAIMGCPVNGPGEAREADLGLAGSRQDAVLFANGKIIRRVTAVNMLDELMQEIRKHIDQAD